jgi:hypothetical protein
MPELIDHRPPPPGPTEALIPQAIPNPSTFLPRRYWYAGPGIIEHEYETIAAWGARAVMAALHLTDTNTSGSERLAQDIAADLRTAGGVLQAEAADKLDLLIGLLAKAECARDTIQPERDYMRPVVGTRKPTNTIEAMAQTLRYALKPLTETVTDPDRLADLLAHVAFHAEARWVAANRERREATQAVEG